MRIVTISLLLLHGLPSSGEVRWQLSGGELTVYRWTIDELVYNPRWPAHAR